MEKVWHDVGQKSDLFAKIDNMLERIQKERSSGSEFRDFKTGIGGMIEGEFLVQALQMRSGTWEPNWEKALLALQKGNVLPGPDAKKAIQSYNFLRRIETTLRRFENKNVSALPTTSEEQTKIAKRLGHKQLESFMKLYHATREAIHALYLRHVKARIN